MLLFHLKLNDKSAEKEFCLRELKRNLFLLIYKNSIAEMLARSRSRFTFIKADITYKSCIKNVKFYDYRFNLEYSDRYCNKAWNFSLVKFIKLIKLRASRRIGASFLIYYKRRKIMDFWENKGRRFADNQNFF